MTVTRGSILLFSFRAKIEEAVSFVPRMCAEEKLKAVQFWNLVSEKLQEIINNSAADINAVALKLDEENSVKVTLESSSAVNIVPQNMASTDLINLPTNYSNCNVETTNLQYQTDELCTTNLKPVISSTTDVSDCSVISASNTVHLNSIPKNCDALSDQFSVVENVSSNNCDPYAINSHSSDISHNFPHSQNSKLISNTEPYVDNCDKSQEFQLEHKSKNYVSADENGREIVVANVQRLRRTKKHRDSKQNGVKASLKSSFVKTEVTTTSSENKIQSEKKFSSVSESSQDSFKEFDPANSDASNDSNSAENIVSFVVSNSEEIIAKNDILLEETNGAISCPISCKDCDQQFTESEALASHHCDQTKRYACSECDALFATKGNLIVHVRKHTGEKPYSCNKCQASFSTKGNLKRHCKIHTGEKPWQCNRCGGRFTEKKSLTVHMRRHTGERPYPCKMCGKKFAQSGILQTHMAMHLDQRFHLCEHCGKSFRQKSQLRIHKLRHDNVRRYCCGSCSARFLTKGDLDRHMRTHTGERPYVCDICSKCFTRQQSLNEHTNRHYGLKPYGCKYCGKGFAEMSACYKHVKQHDMGNEVDSLPNKSSEAEQCLKPESKDQTPEENYENTDPISSGDSSKVITILVDSKANEIEGERSITAPFIHTFLH